MRQFQPEQIDNAPIMETIEITPPQGTAETIVNAVCVDVIDLGKVKTPWGTKPMVKAVFETDLLDEYGEQRILIRAFHKHPHEKSALSIAVKSWCGRNLAEEEEAGVFDLKILIGQQARLKLEPTLAQNGNSFDKVAEILPPGKVHVQAVKYHTEEN